MGFTEDYVYTGETNDTIYHAGFRFRNIAIPQGYPIRWAILYLYMTDAICSDPYVVRYAKVYGEAADDSDAFDVSLPSTRDLTVAYGNYNLHCGGSARWWWAYPTIAIQEIVDRPGWVAGNALSIIIAGYLGQSGDGRQEIKAFERASTRNAKLEINW